MANSFLNSSLVTSKSLANFVALQSFLATADRSFAADFMNQYYQAGQSISIRRRNRIVTSRGLTATPSDITEEYETLSIESPYNAFMQFNSVDETLTLKDYNDRYIEPAIRKLTADIETGIGLQAAQELHYVVGTPGQAINSFNSVMSIQTLMNKLDMPTDKAYLALNADDSQFLKSSLQNAFNPILNKEISFGAQLGHLGIFDIFENTCINRHIAGTAAALAPNTVTITNGPLATGNILQLTGLPQIAGNTDPLALVPNDVLALNPAAEVYWLAELRGVVTYIPATYIVQTFTPGVGGAGTVTVKPDISYSASGLLVGTPISKPIPNNTTLTVLASHNVNMAYCAGGLSVVNPQLRPLQTVFSETKADKDALLSLNLTLAGDVTNLVDLFRITVLLGKKWHPQYCVRVIS